MESMEERPVRVLEPRRLRSAGRAAIALALALCLPHSPSSGQTATTGPTVSELRFSAFPVYDAKTTIKIFQPFADYLADALGRPVRLVSAPNRAVFMERALAGEYDVLWVHNQGHIQLFEAKAATVVAGGAPPFRGIAVVRSDSPIRTVADLKGKRITAVAPDSLGGYLFLKPLFAQAGLRFPDDASFEFAPRIEVIPFQVLEGKADAGVFSEDTYAASPAYASTRDQLRVLASSDPIPQFPFMVRSGLDAALAVRIGEALGAIDGDTDRERALLDSLKVERISRMDDASYAAFRAFYRTITK